jgi:hypothetical protein
MLKITANVVVFRVLSAVLFQSLDVRDAASFTNSAISNG